MVNGERSSGGIIPGGLVLVFKLELINFHKSKWTDISFQTIMLVLSGAVLKMRFLLCKVPAALKMRW